MINPGGFRALLLEALKYFVTHGYTNEVDLADWLMKLHAMLVRELPTDAAIRKDLAGTLERIFTRNVQHGGVVQRVPGVTRYTIDRVAPQLRAELDRRIFAGADLIRLNKARRVQETLQRFSGWVTSVPGRSNVTNLREVASDILKPSRQLKFERRRVAIDQGHKLSAAVAHVVATGNGAIAAIWHDRGEDDPSYDYRPEHLKRSGTILLVRGSWAIEDGLIKKGGLQFTDSIEQPAELPYCSCWYEYITSPRALPEALMTAKGKAWIAGVRLDSLADPVAIRLRTVNGLECAIETGAGETRHGVGKDGRPWRSAMPVDYGYIRRTLGADGDPVDCYIGPNPESNHVLIVDQLDAITGAFDEHKVMLGFEGPRDALEAYVLAFSDGLARQRIGDVREMSMTAFREWLAADAAVA